MAGTEFDYAALRWNQPGVAFAVRDFGRNGLRYAGWSLAGSGAILILGQFGRARHDRATETIGWFAFGFGVFFGVWFLRKCFMYRVKLSAEQLSTGEYESGGGRGGPDRYYFNEYDRVFFFLDAKPASFVLRNRNGRSVEILFDPDKVSVARIRGFFLAGGVEISE